ncbi:MAG: phosphate ABC transporter permease subunit PstC [Spirochaetota bacterium]
MDNNYPDNQKENKYKKDIELKNKLFKVPKLKIGETLFNKSIFITGVLVILLLAGIFITLFVQSVSKMDELGLRFLFSSKWNPVKELYGAIPFLVGTLITSFLALLISLPFSFAIAISLGEYFRKGIFSRFLKMSTEILASIPSIIYGFWGLFFLGPIIAEIEWTLGITPDGLGIITASVVLAIMIIPYSASIAREVIELVPQDLKEAGYAVGASRHQVILKLILPYAKSGIIAGIILALGRAIGETMAVTMVIGNRNQLPDFINEGLNVLFKSSNTMASIIANDFGESIPGTIHYSALLTIGIILLVVTTLINIFGRYIIRKTMVQKAPLKADKPKEKKKEEIQTEVIK